MQQPMQEKLDIKILILFILRRLPDAVDAETLADLALADGDVGYFEYAECLAELEDSGHLTRSGRFYAITEKGDRNCSIVESSLPYSVRSRALKRIAPVEERMRRQAMITARHTLDEKGCMVELAVADGKGEMIHLRLLCSGEEQARKMEKRFRKDAEAYYQKIVELLTE